MARSIRLVYRNKQGRVRINHNWDAITKRSALIITAAEWRAGADPFDATGRPLLGEANNRSP